MKTSSRLSPPALRARVGRLAAATVLGLTLSAAPALAAEDVVSEGGEEAAEAEAEGGGKIQLAEGPRDRVGLIVLGFLGAITVGGGITAARQLRGQRPQASGEFRWR